MLKRKLYTELVAWRRSEPHGALLLTGPGQAGKSTLVEHLDKQEYGYLATINLALDLRRALLRIISGACRVGQGHVPMLAAPRPSQ